jgi:excisionase family DNA binding protein
MAALSLRDAAEQAGVGKSTVWRAIKSGRMSAARTEDGGFAIDPAELFRVFQPGHAAQRPEGQDTTAIPATDAMDETALKQALAVADANVQALRELLAEVKASRDELRADRDDWRARHDRLAIAPPIAAPAPAPTNGSVADPLGGGNSPPPKETEPHRSWIRYWFGWRAA